MIVLKLRKSGELSPVRYKGLIQYAPIVSNDPIKGIIILKIRVGGCCGTPIYQEIEYKYDSFDLNC